MEIARRGLPLVFRSILLIVSLTILNPADAQLEESLKVYEAAARVLQEHGVKVTLVSNGKTTYLYIPSRGQGTCPVPLCRAIRRVDRIINNEVSVVLTDSPEQLEVERSGWAVIDIRAVKLSELLGFNDLQLRRGIQEVLINQGMRNHLLNGHFIFPKVGGIHQAKFSAQNFYIQAHERRSLRVEQDDPRIYEELFLGVAQFLSDWTNTNVIVQSRSNPKVLINEKNEYTISDSKGNSYIFYSDLDWPEMRFQIRNQLVLIKEAARLWVQSLTRYGPVQRDNLVRLRNMFKSSDLEVPL